MGFAGSSIKRYLSFMLVALFLTGCAGSATALRQEKAEPLAKLQRVEIKDGENTLGMLILTDRPVGFTTVRVADPPKMVVELSGAELGDVRQTIKVGKGPVEYITPSTAPDSPGIVRLEIGLTGPVACKTAQSGQAIHIVFEKQKDEAKAEPAKTAEPPVTGTALSSKPEIASPAKAEGPAAAAAAPGPAREAKENSVTKAAPVVAAMEKPAESRTPAKAEAPAPVPDAKSVGGVTYEKGESGYLVRIDGDGKFARPNVFKLGRDRVVIDLPGVASTKEKLTLEVNGQPLRRIRMARHEGPDKKVRIVLDLGGAAVYAVKSEGKSLLVTIVSPGSKFVAKSAAALAVTSKAAPANNHVMMSKAEAPKAEGNAAVKTETRPESPAVQKVEAKAASAGEKPGRPINVYISKTDGRAILSSSPIEPGAAGSVAVGPDSKNYVETSSKIYTGGRISFDVQDADLDKVIKLLADVAGMNLILDPNEVKGKVTLKLDNVPWDQALDILLKIYDLDKVVEGNVLRVASRNKLNEEKRKELLQVAEQKKLEQQAEDLYTRTFKVNYTTATELEPKVKKILSPRGEAIANPTTNEIIVTDIKENIARAGELIAILDKQVNQIMIEARILTVDVGYSQSLGVTWGLTRKSGSNPNIGAVGGSGSQGVTGTPPGVIGITPAASPGGDSYQINLPKELAATAAGGLMGSFAWGHLLNGVNLDLTIQALEDINKAEVLAAPKVFTLENQSANIVSGTTLYVQTTSAAGTAPAPLNANLSLTVTPRVTGNDYVMMQVTATNNTPVTTPPPGSTAAINTQAVTTNVIVKDGDTIVLGGIYTKNKSHQDSHIPLLGRIPIIKYLFSSNSWSDTTSELLIFITPKLVKQSQKV